MSAIKKFLQFMLKIFFKIFFSFFNQEKLNPELKKTMSLYKGEGFNELFSKIRAWDSPFQELEKNIPKSGLIVDLGSGDGLLGNYLAISSSKRKIFGMELNRDRVALSDKNIINTSFRQGDILKDKFPANADAYILAHVLHHLYSKESQVYLIKKLSKNLKKDKKLIILEISNKPLLKYWFTWFTDAVVVPILFEGKLFNLNFYYRKSEEWGRLLKKNSFKVKIKSAHSNKPFSHILILATKK